MWVSVNSRPVLLYLSFSHIEEVNFRGFQYNMQFQLIGGGGR